MLTLWNPFVPVKRSERGFNSYFDDMIDGMFRSSLGINQIKNEDGSTSIDIDIPGIKEEDISVHLSEDNILTIKGERKTQTSTYSVNKSFTLPEDCDADTLLASLKDGVLTLSLAPKKIPKVKELKKIPITVK